LEEWDEVGRAPGNICGLIETTEMQNPSPAAGRVVQKKLRKNGL
jgi:hypothetical protein